MDSVEYTNLRNQIFDFAKKGKYQEAAQIADQIDWSIVQNIKTIDKVNMIYLRCKRYQDSLRMMEIIYGRNEEDLDTLKRICTVAAALGEQKKTISYYEKFLILEKDPLEKKIMKYRIWKALGVGDKELIRVLKSILKVRYISRWAYELAKLYMKTDEQEACIRECCRIVEESEPDEYTRKADRLRIDLGWKPAKHEEAEKVREDMSMELAEEVSVPEAPEILEEKPEGEEEKTVDPEEAEKPEELTELEKAAEELEESTKPEKPAEEPAEPEEEILQIKADSTEEENLQIERSLAELSGSYEGGRNSSKSESEWADEAEEVLRRF